MKMDSKKMRRELESRLENENRVVTYDRDKDQLRIESKRTGKGITVALAGIVAKWHDEKDKAIDEVVYYVEEGLRAFGRGSARVERIAGDVHACGSDGQGGFIEVEELIFGERSAVVVDPTEEKIKAEFEGVKRTYLPMHSVLRIDEVRKQGISKISAFEGTNVAQFPMPIYTPGDKK